MVDLSHLKPKVLGICIILTACSVIIFTFLFANACEDENQKEIVFESEHSGNFKKTIKIPANTKSLLSVDGKELSPECLTIIINSNDLDINNKTKCKLVEYDQDYGSDSFDYEPSEFLIINEKSKSVEYIIEIEPSNNKNYYIIIINEIEQGNDLLAILVIFGPIIIGLIILIVCWISGFGNGGFEPEEINKIIVYFFILINCGIWLIYGFTYLTVYFYQIYQY